jgi:hypothetical protein
MTAHTRFIAIVKRDCETCQLIGQVLAELSQSTDLTLYSQDDTTFPGQTGGALDDTALEQSWRYRIESVPTLIKFVNGNEVERTEGWVREEWRTISGMDGLGESLPAFRPGCGSLSQYPGMPERLALRYGDIKLTARQVEVADEQDLIEVSYDRGWSDGLPIVPATDLRVARMLAATDRKPDDIIGDIPPNLVSCSIEKVAINAVMAGCRPEYFPVVLATVEAALKPEFSMHGLLATLWYSGPVVIVNGPVARQIGMNSGGNALGQGNRANATIGRALQLLIRNVGGGVPGEIDRSVLGNPGKYTFCFAEDESDPDWQPLNIARGAQPGSSSVTLFHGDGVQAAHTRDSRTPEELCQSLAASLWSVGNPKFAMQNGAILVLCPDHYEIFKQAGWGRIEIESSLHQALKRPREDLLAGAGGIAEGIDPQISEPMIDKFNPGYLLVVRAGGKGGGMSAIIGGWSAQRRKKEVQIVTQDVLC